LRRDFIVDLRELAAMRPFGGTIRQTSMSDADEQELAEEFTGQG
jgi:hypothetical protein